MSEAIHLRVRAFYVFFKTAQRALRHIIVAVNIHDIIAACKRQTRVPRTHKTLVFLVTHSYSAVARRIAVRNLAAAVRRAVVNQNKLKIRT